MSLALLGHPSSSHTQQVLIALWLNDTPFEFRMVDGQHPDNLALLAQHSPFNQFSVLIDEGRALFESTHIIEFPDERHRSAHRLIPPRRQRSRSAPLSFLFSAWHPTATRQMPPRP